MTNYAKLDSLTQRHHERFKRFVVNRVPRLTCQECHGEGGETVPVLDYGQGPFEECFTCEGTGYVTPHIRAQWLRWKKDEKRAKGA